MDIDLDVQDREKFISLIKHIPALEKYKDGEIKKHLVGIHIQDIPVDPMTGISSIDYKTAEEMGFFKIDILNNHVYDDMTNKDIERYMSIEPDWKLLENKKIVEKLPHIHNHYTLLKKFKPKNIHELAAFLALIRPSKKYLRGKSKDVIMKNIWKREKSGYFFKKSHAYAYALMIIVKLNYLSNKKDQGEK